MWRSDTHTHTHTHTHMRREEQISTERERKVRLRYSQWLIWMTARRDEGLERETFTQAFSPTIVKCNQIPVRLDGVSSWWAGMWLLRAPRADWWDQERGGMYWLLGQWEQNGRRGSPWPVLTPLSSHVLCLRPEKRGGNREKGEERRWRGRGLLSADSRRQNVSRLQKGEAQFVCSPGLRRRDRSQGN